MENIDDGGPAFPGKICIGHTPGDEIPIYQHPPGMSLRDYLAAHAPADEVADLIPETRGKCAASAGNTLDEDGSDDHLKLDCKARYKWADAMIEARKR